MKILYRLRLSAYSSTETIGLNKMSANINNIKKNKKQVFRSTTRKKGRQRKKP